MSKQTNRKAIQSKTRRRASSMSAMRDAPDGDHWNSEVQAPENDWANGPAPASYKKCGLSDFDGNPLIEALPPFPGTDEELAKRMERFPRFEGAELSLPPNLRLLCVSRLKDLYVPQARHVEVARTLLAVLYAGYRARNPLTAQGRQLAHGGEFGSDNTMALLVAHSGMGKSSLVARLLQILGPRLICHADFYGTPTYVSQLLTVEVGCSSGDSTKGLCTAILSAIDARCGTSYVANECGSTASGPNLSLVTAQVLRNFNVGMVFVDEAHHLRARGKSEKAKLLDSLVTFRQRTSVPFALIGTQRASGIFGAEFSTSRRLCEAGLLELPRYESANEGDWTELCYQLWKFQWIQKPIELDDEIINVLWNLTQGITGVLIALFAQAQRNAITYRTERVDKDLLEATYSDQFTPLHEAINALRGGRKEDIAKFDDLWEQHKDFIQQCLGQPAVSKKRRGS